LVVSGEKQLQGGVETIEHSDTKQANGQIVVIPVFVPVNEIVDKIGGLLGGHQMEGQVISSFDGFETTSAHELLTFV
jgi:hypothetical protein